MMSLLFIYTVPVYAEAELQEYIIGGMQDYNLARQQRNYDKLIISSPNPGGKGVVKTTYEGNLVYSRFDYTGKAENKPGEYQVMRYHQIAVNMLRGEILWEDSKNIHASFMRNGKQYYMTVNTGNGSPYEVRILDVVDLDMDVDILDDPE
jgi:hypothetical protein